MASSGSSMVISFSIAILLLLILLLLLSYNTKCKNDKVERFEGESSQAMFPPFKDVYDKGIGSLTSLVGGSSPSKKGGEKFSNLNGAPITDNYSLLSNINGGDCSNYGSSTNDASYNIKDYNDPSSCFNRNNTSSGPVTTEKFTNMYEGSPITDNYSLLANTAGTECPTNGSSIDVAYTTGEFQDPTTCFKRDRLSKTDLLPADATDKWSQINPSSSGDIADKNFLTAGYHIGINTVGQSMRNANLQLRSEIPNPQVAVSPWLISTIEPDIRPVSFEIGSAPSTSA